MQGSQHRSGSLPRSCFVELMLFHSEHAAMWNDTDTPLAYFISFRSYGTWLHGDKRGSIDRFHNRYKTPYMARSEIWRDYNQQHLRTEPLLLKAVHRKWIEAAIRETCAI